MEKVNTHTFTPRVSDSYVRWIQTELASHTKQIPVFWEFVKGHLYNYFGSVASVVSVQNMLSSFCPCCVYQEGCVCMCVAEFNRP